MSHMVHCVKLGKDLPGLKFPPFKGELGERIYTNISEEAWKLWLGHSTMVINENRLNPAEPAAQEVLRKQLGRLFVRRRCRHAGGLRACQKVIIIKTGGVRAR